MRYITILMFMLASTRVVCAQGPCTETAVKEGKVQMAKDAFSYMPPFGKPVTGKGPIEETAEKKFAGRTILGLDDLALMLFDFGSRGLEDFHIHDVVAAVHAIRPVPADEHADFT